MPIYQTAAQPANDTLTSSFAAAFNLQSELRLAAPAAMSVSGTAKMSST